MPSTCVIFDIDGTLVDSGAFEGPLYWRAVSEVLGDTCVKADWSEYEHVTDAGILLEVCRDNGLELLRFEQQVRTRFGELVAEHLSAASICPPIAGALAFWKQLRAHPGIEIGIATGGWGHTARMKLDAAGYEYSGIPMATSDDGHERTRIMDRCRAMFAPSMPTIYIGDGEWDMAASAHLGWYFLGVGPRLRGKCQNWIPDFQSEDLMDRVAAGN